MSFFHYALLSFLHVALHSRCVSLYLLIPTFECPHICFSLSLLLFYVLFHFVDFPFLLFFLSCCFPFLSSFFLYVIVRLITYSYCCVCFLLFFHLVAFPCIIIFLTLLFISFTPPFILSRCFSFLFIVIAFHYCVFNFICVTVICMRISFTCTSIYITFTLRVSMCVSAFVHYHCCLFHVCIHLFTSFCIVTFTSCGFSIQ